MPSKKAYKKMKSPYLGVVPSKIPPIKTPPIEAPSIETPTIETPTIETPPIETPPINLSLPTKEKPTDKSNDRIV
jgi:hypothetical protein